MQVRQHVCIDISDSYREKTMQNIEAHKLRAYDQYPHWSVRMFKMKMVICCCHEGREVPTAATDGTHIFVNPEFWWGLDIELRTFLLVHEVAHVMLGHPWRRGKRDHYCWNVAGDEIINYILHKQAQLMGRSVTIPDGWIFPPAEREGWSEERDGDLVVFKSPDGKEFTSLTDAVEYRTREAYHGAGKRDTARPALAI